MQSIPEADLLLTLLALALMVALGRLAGDLARRLGQPEVLGQLFAGVLLGPSVFGLILPDPYRLVAHNSLVGATLSTFSWIGAILLLTLAGAEINTAALGRQLKPSLLAATGAIVPSLIAGALFARLVLGVSGIFLGIVLAVTATGELTSILLERGELERRYAQVMLTAGMISEVVVWPLVSVASSAGRQPAWLALAIAAVTVLGFFLVALTVGRRFLHWNMRRVADLVPLRDGRLSLILTFTLFAAAVTQLLGLHVLLGAFVFGLLLRNAPRFDLLLRERIESVTVAFFGPIFFVFAGAEINLSQLRSLSALTAIVLLLVIATVVKVGFAGLGAWLGGLPGIQALLVGTGLNLRGGTAITVAIIGVELHVLSSAAFALYAMTSIIIIAVTPAILAQLAERAQPTQEERAELARGVVERRAYVAHLQRVLLPQVPQLLPLLTAEVARVAAVARQRVGEAVDLVEIVPQPPVVPPALGSQVAATLQRADAYDRVRVLEEEVEGLEIVSAMMAAARPGDLISIGARPPRSRTFSLGNLQDALLRNGEVDVMATISAADRFDCAGLRRVLVPVSGLEDSLAAADIAGLLASGCQAKVVVMTVVRPAARFPLASDDRDLRQVGQSIVDEAAFRLSRFNISIVQCVRLGNDIAGQILRELSLEEYQLVVLGGTERGRGDRLYLGGMVEAVLTQIQIPATLFVARRTDLPFETSGG